jgi:hypothetical protein
MISPLARREAGRAGGIGVRKVEQGGTSGTFGFQVHLYIYRFSPGTGVGDHLYHLFHLFHFIRRE